MKIYWQVTLSLAARWFKSSFDVSFAIPRWGSLAEDWESQQRQPLFFDEAEREDLHDIF